MSSPQSDVDYIPQTVPRYLYRIDYQGAQTRFSPTDGFRAKNRSTILNTPLLIERAATAHLTGATNYSSPFVSIFADRPHAERWGRDLAARKPGLDVHVVKIDSMKLCRGTIFWVSDLLKRYGLGDQVGSWNHYMEYLIINRIPVEAVVDEWRVGGVVDGVMNGLGLD